MRFLSRIACSLFLLLALASASVGATVTVTLTGGQGRNQVQQSAIVATENILQVNVDDGQGRPRSVMLYSPDTDWIYRTTTATSTTDCKVAKGQTLTLEYAATTTAYFLRQTADGTLVILPVR